MTSLQDFFPRMEVSIRLWSLCFGACSQHKFTKKTHRNHSLKMGKIRDEPLNHLKKLPFLASESSRCSCAHPTSKLSKICIQITHLSLPIMLLMVQKSGVHQLIWRIYHYLRRVLAPSQVVVWDF